MTWETLKSTGEKLDISNTVMGYSRNDPHSPFPLLNKWTPPPLDKKAQFTQIMNLKK